MTPFPIKRIRIDTRRRNAMQLAIYREERPNRFGWPTPLYIFEPDIVSDHDAPLAVVEVPDDCLLRMIAAGVDADTCTDPYDLDWDAFAARYGVDSPANAVDSGRIVLYFPAEDAYMTAWDALG